MSSSTNPMSWDGIEERYADFRRQIAELRSPAQPLQGKPMNAQLAQEIDRQLAEIEAMDAPKMTPLPPMPTSPAPIPWRWIALAAMVGAAVGASAVALLS